MKRSLHLFWSREDENLFAGECVDRGLNMMFINDCYWPTPSPPAYAHLSECHSKFVYLWNPDLAPDLPCRLHFDGVTYHGPQSGVVIQLIRSETHDDVLRYGTISVGFDEANVQYARWVKGVFKVVDAISAPGLACIEPLTGQILTAKPFGFRAGPNAAAWVRAKPGRFFRDNTVANHYGIAR